MAGDMDVHIVLDDPAGNSYLQVLGHLSFSGL